MAVGFNGSHNATTTNPVADVYSTGQWWFAPWGQVTAPTHVTNVDLAQVSCSSPGTCVAVGSSEAKGAPAQPFIASLSKGAWTGATAPLPGTAQTGATAGGILSSVKCNASGTCVAVGSYQRDDHSTRALIVSGTPGTGWGAASPQQPSSTAKSALLTAVSCATAASCMAVGTYIGKTTGQFPFAMVASGGPPSATPIPLPPSAVAGGKDLKVALTSMTCPTAGRCFAVGRFNGTADQTLPLVATVAAATWKSVQEAVPANATTAGHEYALLRSVSCRGPVECVAVGSYVDPTGRFYGMIDPQGGTAFYPTEAPKPANAGPAGSVTGTTGLTAVACSSPG